MNLNTELGYELKEMEKKMPKHDVNSNTTSVEEHLQELKAFKKKLDLNNLRMITIKEKIGEIAQAVERVEKIEEVQEESKQQLSEDPVENLVLQFNSKSETQLTKISDGLYKVLGKTL